MPGFLDLPIELLPLILQQLVRPSHIAAVCLANKTFYIRCSAPVRACIHIRMAEGRKAKVVKLFRALAEHPHLARHVQRLEIRDFPKALQSADHENVLQVCLNGIRNCINLRACTWTRHGSVTSRILEALLSCPHLQELEINGQHSGYYEPSILARFTHVRRISLIMPSGPVTDVLPAWTQATEDALKHLSFICKSSPLIHDGTLESMAPHLANLEQLYIVGCPKVTDRGLLAVLVANRKGLRALGMEGLSAALDMTRFSEQCTRLGALACLRSITLSIPAQTNPKWEADVLSLLAPTPLEQFHISTVGGQVGPSLSEEFCTALVDAHGARLRRFSVHRMSMSMASIEDVCRRCVQLEQLFVVVEQGALESLGAALAQAYRLRAVHVNRPLDLGSEDVPVMARAQILSIVKQCGPNLMQFGYNTRVLQVERAMNRREDGSLEVDVRLASYESPEIPEQFLVVRT